MTAFARFRALSVIAMLLLTALLTTPLRSEEQKKESKEAEAKGQSLFDGKTLGHWKETKFGGGGEPAVEDGALVLPMGERLSGVTWDGPAIPKNNYEISLEAKRVNGSDFFCGLTFPVNDSFASLIVGGWGGTLCGISSLDSNDAANNETTKIRKFETGQWYKIRMRVLKDRLQAWIDDEAVVDVDISHHKIDVRHEVKPSEPLGLSSFQTGAAFRNIRMHKIDEKPDAKPAEKAK